MKRDIDLLRDILLQIENAPAGKSIDDSDIAGSEYDPDIIRYHIKLLYDAELIEGHEIPMAGSALPGYVISSLSSDGFDFLDAIREKTTWEKIKSKACAAGSLSLKAVIAAADIKDLLR
ncbi:MAG: DUF2513 domain-containing protein [Bacillota bacterium]